MSLIKPYRWLTMCLAVFCILSLPAMAIAKEQFYILLPINVNRADALTLSRVMDGVGPKKAAAIVEYREHYGYFKSIDSLRAVKGIGRGTLEKNRGRITVD